MTRRKKLGRKSRTVQLELRLLKKALEHAQDCALIPSVPKFPKLRLTDARAHRFLTPEESEKLLAALRPLDEQPHEVTRGAPPVRRDRLSYLAVLVALNTGMRRTQIMTRGWQDVAWDRGPHGVLFVTAKPEVGFEVKTRRPRAIPLTPELRRELERAHEEVGRPEAGWIFPSTSDPKKPRFTFRKALVAACRRVGLAPIHPHGLRHT